MIRLSERGRLQRKLEIKEPKREERLAKREKLVAQGGKRKLLPNEKSERQRKRLVMCYDFHVPTNTSCEYY